MKQKDDQPTAKLPAVKVLPVTQKSIWHVGLRQILASLPGTIFYAFLSHLNVVLLLSSGSLDVFFPALLVLLLLGAIYGPWVGLIVGGFGYLLGDILARTWLRDLSWSNGYLFVFVGNTLNTFRDLVGWYGFAGYLVHALFGVGAGLTLAYTGKHFRSFDSLAAVGLICSLMLALGIALVVYIAVPLYQSPYYSWGNATTAFLDTILPNVLIAMVLVPLFLLLYDLMLRRRKHR